MTARSEVSLLEPLTILDAPDRGDVQYLDDRINEFNMSRTGITDVRPLAVFVRDDRTEIVAGVHGWTWGGCCEVKTLWVHEQWRGLDLGTRLIAAVENEARARGARQIVLSTHSFQAPDFYRRLGFEPIGHFEDYPVGYQSIYLRKPLL